MILIRSNCQIHLSTHVMVDPCIWPSVWDSISRDLSSDPVMRCIDKVIICSIISSYPPIHNSVINDIKQSYWEGSKAFRMSITKYASPMVYRVPSTIGDNRPVTTLHRMFDQFGAPISTAIPGHIEIRMTLSPCFVGICDQTFLKTQVQHNLQKIEFKDGGVIDDSLKLLVNILALHLSLEISLESQDHDEDSS